MIDPNVKVALVLALPAAVLGYYDSGIGGAVTGLGVVSLLLILLWVKDAIVGSTSGSYGGGSDGFDGDVGWDGGD